MARYGIVVDLDRCVGCMTCVLSCKEENLTRPGVWWNQILQVESEAQDRIVYVRYACMHCDEPPCMAACPNEAIYRRPDGVVLVDQNKCAGVQACVEACPYDVIVMTPDAEYFPEEGGFLPAGEEALAPYRQHQPGKASMCTLCYQRIDVGRQPACVEGCPSKAMTFVDLDDHAISEDPSVLRSQPMDTDVNSKPKVTYVFPERLGDEIKKKVRENPYMLGG